MKLGGRYPVLFLTLFGAYAYFHQGGGWNQNSRFNQVRSLTEEGRWTINRFWAYAARDGGGELLERSEVPDPMPPGFVPRGVNTLDVALYEGRIYPNKPPGTTLLALPAYAVAWRLERLLGVDPEAWQTLNLNLYLVTVFSIGLAGACLGVLVFGLSRRLHPDLDGSRHAAAALALGLGTLILPFSTMFFDHVAAAAATLAGFGLVFAACEAAEKRRRARRLVAAGLVLGCGVVVNYTVILATALFALDAAARLRRRSAELGFLVAGGLLPAVFLLWYHDRAFGSMWTIANTHQPQLFLDEGHVIGVFSLPDAALAVELLVGSERGLLTSSPVLVLVIYGLAEAFRRKRRRLEAGLSLAVLGVFLLMNVSYNWWHGGNSFGPRLLIPAVPLLALHLAPAFARWPRASAGLAAVSTALVLAATAANPQVPADVEHPMLEYVLPGFFSGGADAGTAVSDPVSRNATGVYEAYPFRVFGPGSRPARWNSFNLGEFVRPHSAASLLPLLVVLTCGTLWLLRRPPAKAER